MFRLIPWFAALFEKREVWRTGVTSCVKHLRTRIKKMDTWIRFGKQLLVLLKNTAFLGSLMSYGVRRCVGAGPRILNPFSEPLSQAGCVVAASG